MKTKPERVFVQGNGICSINMKLNFLEDKIINKAREKRATIAVVKYTKIKEGVLQRIPLASKIPPLGNAFPGMTEVSNEDDANPQQFP